MNVGSLWDHMVVLTHGVSRVSKMSRLPLKASRAAP